MFVTPASTWTRRWPGASVTSISNTLASLCFSARYVPPLKTIPPVPTDSGVLAVKKPLSMYRPPLNVFIPPKTTFREETKCTAAGPPISEIGPDTSRSPSASTG